MGIADLSLDEIESGLNDPFVRALRREIRKRHGAAVRSLIDVAVAGLDARICAHAGRIEAFEEILRMINVEGEKQQ